MTEEHLRKILTFFFFATLDNKKAKLLSKKCWNWCLTKKNSQPKLSSEEILVLSLAHFWDQLKKENRHGVTQITEDSGWILKPDFRLEIWVGYYKNASEEEIFALLLYKVLQFSPETISKCLGISKGTINYRTSKGVKKIGQLVLENGGVF